MESGPYKKLSTRKRPRQANSRYHLGKSTRKRENLHQQEASRPSGYTAGLQQTPAAQGNEHATGQASTSKMIFLSLHHPWPWILLTRAGEEGAAIQDPSPPPVERWTRWWPQGSWGAMTVKITPETPYFTTPESSGSLGIVVTHCSLLGGRGECIFPTINFAQSRCHAGPWGDSHALQGLRARPGFTQRCEEGGCQVRCRLQSPKGSGWRRRGWRSARWPRSLPRGRWPAGQHGGAPSGAKDTAGRDGGQVAACVAQLVPGATGAEDQGAS